MDAEHETDAIQLSMQQSISAIAPKATWRDARTAALLLSSALCEAVKASVVLETMWTMAARQKVIVAPPR
jgi:hypothetical protein